MSFLKIENLTAGFMSNIKNPPVLRGVNLEIARGSRHALIGQTGAGKSVLGLSIVNLLPENARLTGKVFFQGKNLLDCSEKEMMRLRGKEMMMIFQNPFLTLNPVLSIEAQLCEIPMFHEGMNRSRARVRAREMLYMCGLKEPQKIMQAYPHEMSGGMLQRVALAMGIICHPKLLIADEPLKGLDVSRKKQLALTLAKVCQELGITLLLITHNLKVAQYVCDVSSVMYQGQIVETAAAKDLFLSPSHAYSQKLVQTFYRFEQVEELCN
ncbi:ABC transporter ATP-binding protein [Desulfobacula phenolica]|uniref:ABC-type dipeptide/oligopeptide/nickel transport system, ATPase component n=1 Tax=Desulfobacula phenolica TaxID=90732 RepID=A0A1H2ICB8_9BACT|nr:ABC transporter ATP-binding protein [Desulfobacula phenolica]SDU41645.1 ABC-type dipeptide/oligopeptide/nickel transport system, ATPase component [Desulfobacula phenolica]